MEERLKGVIDSINKFNEEIKKEIYEKFGIKIDKNSIEIDLISREENRIISLEEIANNKELNKIIKNYNYLNSLFDPIINFKD